MQAIYQRMSVRQYWIPLVTSRASRRRCWGHLLIYTSWSRVPLRGGWTPTLKGVGPNHAHLSFCCEPFGQEQRTQGIASVPKWMKQFITPNGNQADSARFNNSRSKATTTTLLTKVPRPPAPVQLYSQWIRGPQYTLPHGIDGQQPRVEVPTEVVETALRFLRVLQHTLKSREHTVTARHNCSLNSKEGYLLFLKGS